MSAFTEEEAATLDPRVPEVPKDLQAQLSAGLQATKTYPFSTGMSEEDFKARVAKIVWIKDHLMQEGTHYGTTPGCNKPSLYQPGAQMLNIIFQHAPSYQRESERLEKNEHGRRDFLCNVNCTLTHYPSGLVVGAGVGGSCTAEARWAKKPVFDVYNSTLKIAAKRAYVAATVSCVGVSEIWTQDTEDNPELYRDEESPQPPTGKPHPRGNHAAPTKPAPEPVTLKGVVSGYESRASNGQVFHGALVGADRVVTLEFGDTLRKLAGAEVTVSAAPTKKPHVYHLRAIQAVSNPNGNRAPKPDNAPRDELPGAERTPYEEVQRQIVEEDTAELWVLKAAKTLKLLPADTFRLADVGTEAMRQLIQQWPEVIAAAHAEESFSEAA